MLFNIIFILITIPNVLAQIRCNGPADCACKMIKVDTTKDTNCSSTAVKEIPATLPPTTVATTVPKRVCPENFEEIRNYCLMMINPNYFAEQDNYCSNIYGQHLATIDSAAENQVMVDFIAQKGKNTAGNFFYTAAYYVESWDSVGWQWNKIPKTQLGYYYWDINEPNLTVDPSDKCMKLTYTGLWKATSCKDKAYAICEADDAFVD